MRKVNALKCHRTIGTQVVGIQKDARFTSQFVHLVHDVLVLQAVVLVVVPLAVTLTRSSDFLVVCQFCQSFQQFATEWNLRQIGVGHLILSFYPGCCLCRGVVL